MTTFKVLGIEPIQAMQTFVNSQKTPIILGKPFLVRAYVNSLDEDDFVDLDAGLIVLIKDVENDRIIAETDEISVSSPVLPGARLQTAARSMGDSEYLAFCRNHISNSLNWIVTPDQPNVLSTNGGSLALNEKEREKEKLHLCFFLRVRTRPTESGKATTTKEISQRFLNSVDENAVYEISNALPSRLTSVQQRPYPVRCGYQLAVNVLGLRYRQYTDEPFYTQPTASQYHLARYFSENGFPVARLNWSTLNIDAPSEFRPPFSLNRHAGTDYRLHEQINLANAFVSAIRMNDIDSGGDHRKLYYGMVNDSSGYFEGAASDVPDKPSFHAVAVGPADDISGYYFAHELGHLLGLTHSGGDGQRAEIYLDSLRGSNRVSNKKRDDLLIKFDADVQRIERLPWREYADFMSYDAKLWVSHRSYLQMIQRFEQLREKHPPTNHDEHLRWVSATKTRFLYVAGVYNHQKRNGKIEYVLPLSRDVDYGVRSDLKAPRCTTNTPAESDESLPDAQIQTNDYDPAEVNNLTEDNNPKENDIPKGDNPENNIILTFVDDAGRTAHVEHLMVRRRILDFPHETGMFQGLINVSEMNKILHGQEDSRKGTETSRSSETKLSLLLRKRQDLVDVCGPNRKAIYTTLDSRILSTTGDGAIWADEIDIGHDRDGFGYVLRIQRQLSEANFHDSRFVVEIAPLRAERSTWRTIGVSVRAGDSVFIDGSDTVSMDGDDAGPLPYTVPAKTREEFVRESDETISNQTDPTDAAARAVSLVGSDATVSNEARVENLLNELGTGGCLVEELRRESLSAKERTLFCRLRISAYMGLDKVVAFDGLIAESSREEGRIFKCNVLTGRRLDYIGVHNSEQREVEDKTVDPPPLEEEESRTVRLAKFAYRIFLAFENEKAFAGKQSERKVTERILFHARLAGIPLERIRLDQGMTTIESTRVSYDVQTL